MSGYPSIFNGDHAEFEQEWAGKDPKTRPDWPMPSFNAVDWAEAFCKINPAMDEGTMIGWFACALMRGFDEHAARTNKTATVPPHPAQSSGGAKDDRELLNEAWKLLECAYSAHQKMGFEGTGDRGHSHEVRMFAMHFSLPETPKTPEHTILSGDGRYWKWRREVRAFLSADASPSPSPPEPSDAAVEAAKKLLAAGSVWLFEAGEDQPIAESNGYRLTDKERQALAAYAVDRRARS